MSQIVGQTKNKYTKIKKVINFKVNDENAKLRPKI